MPNMIARARRAARSVNLIASLSRSRQISTNNLGGFMLSDENNCLVEGANYDLSAEEVIASCRARREAA